MEIVIKNKLSNTSLQVGDIAYYTTLTNIGSTVDSAGNDVHSGIDEGGDIKKIGPISEINLSLNKIKIDTNNVVNTPSVDDFIMFSKNTIVNNTSLIGYYAEIKLNNSSKDKVELFSLSSEAMLSSK
tara:strand:- start:919 stop:1299 length:381 start_codon:yes stop_codon:yes gene_type:complete